MRDVENLHGYKFPVFMVEEKVPEDPFSSHIYKVLLRYLPNTSSLTSDLDSFKSQILAQKNEQKIPFYNVTKIRTVYLQQFEVFFYMFNTLFEEY